MFLLHDFLHWRIGLIINFDTFFNLRKNANLLSLLKVLSAIASKRLLVLSFRFGFWKWKRRFISSKWFGRTWSIWIVNHGFWFRLWHWITGHHHLVWDGRNQWFGFSRANLRWGLILQDSGSADKWCWDNPVHLQHPLTRLVGYVITRIVATHSLIHPYRNILAWRRANFDEEIEQYQEHYFELSQLLRRRDSDWHHSI